jgi:hypothetical protein
MRLTLNIHEGPAKGEEQQIEAGSGPNHPPPSRSKAAVTSSKAQKTPDTAYGDVKYVSLQPI